MENNEKHLNDLLNQALKENEEMRNLLEEAYKKLNFGTEYYVYNSGNLGQVKTLIKEFLDK